MDVFLLADLADELAARGEFSAAIYLYEKCRNEPEPESDGEGHWHTYWEAKIDLLDMFLHQPVRITPVPRITIE